MPVLENRDIVPHDPNMGVAPIGPQENIAGAVALVRAFEQAKTSLLRKQDIMTIPSKAGTKTYITRSGWRLIAMAFNISDEIVSRELTKTACIYVVRAVAPNGRSAVGVGAAEAVEKNRQLSLHDMIATAHTRAKSRAIADLVGAGEVSAEEIGLADEAPDYIVPAPAAPAPPPAKVSPARVILDAFGSDKDDKTVRPKPVKATKPAKTVPPPVDEYTDMVADELVMHNPGLYKTRDAAIDVAREAIEARQRTQGTSYQAAATALLADLRKPGDDE